MHGSRCVSTIQTPTIYITCCSLSQSDTASAREGEMRSSHLAIYNCRECLTGSFPTVLTCARQTSIIAVKIYIYTFYYFGCFIYTLAGMLNEFVHLAKGVSVCIRWLYAQVSVCVCVRAYRVRCTRLYCKINDCNTNTHKMACHNLEESSGWAWTQCNALIFLEAAWYARCSARKRPHTANNALCVHIYDSIVDRHTHTRALSVCACAAQIT